MAKNQPLANTAIHSDEINEIISYRPHWVIRWGIGIIAGIIGLLLIISWFIEYPDVLQAPMRLIAVNAPKKLVARTDGKLERLLVHNGDAVKKDELLAFMQSTGKHAEVLAMKNWVTELEKHTKLGNIENLDDYPIPPWSALGELQQAFVAFEPIYLETLQLMIRGYYPQKMNSLNRDLALIKAEEKILQKQKLLIEQDYALQKTDYTARERLVKEKVMAPLELLQDKSKMIAKENAMHQIAAQLVNQQAESFTKEQQILELRKQMNDQKSKFTTALFQFKNHINEWLNRYVIIAPEDGNVQFISALQQNQNILNGQDLFFIAPKNHAFYGEVMARQSGLGKIALNQQVLIKLDSYPSAEFGYLSGHVDYISPFPLRDSSFVIRVALPQGMKTNYGKILPYKNNLQAKAEIITKNQRLLERFTAQFRDLLNRK